MKFLVKFLYILYIYIYANIRSKKKVCRTSVLSNLHFRYLHPYVDLRLVQPGEERDSVGPNSNLSSYKEITKKTELFEKTLRKKAPHNSVSWVYERQCT